MILLLMAMLAPPSESEVIAMLAEQRNWKAEVVLADESRADLLSDDHAIEVERASKWKEAPAQAVLYAILTRKQPMVILFTDSKRRDKPHILRCYLVCEKLEIPLEVIVVGQ